MDKYDGVSPPEEIVLDTFRVWDARLTSVFILFLIYLGALRFQKEIE
jgi:hypothetical protein